MIGSSRQAAVVANGIENAGKAECTPRILTKIRGLRLEA
jgi:hypothetical protein